jgi:Tfp pilus assembly ATPase PilU
MADKTIGKMIPLSILRKHKINKAHVKKLTVTDCKNIQKAVMDANRDARGDPGCGVCCTVPPP